jgi:hypothetical protein
MKFNYFPSFGQARTDEVVTELGKMILTLGVGEKRIEFCLNGLNGGYGYTYVGIGAFENDKRIKFVPIEGSNCEWEILNEKQKKDK